MYRCQLLLTPIKCMVFNLRKHTQKLMCRRFDESNIISKLNNQFDIFSLFSQYNLQASSCTAFKYTRIFTSLFLFFFIFLFIILFLFKTIILLNMRRNKYKICKYNLNFFFCSLTILNYRKQFHYAIVNTNLMLAKRPTFSFEYAAPYSDRV